MKYLIVFFLIFLISINAAVSFEEKENAYRFNNLGVAFLEQFKYQEAAREFRKALKISPDLTMAQMNLAIAEFNLPDLESASAEAKKALMLRPEMPEGHYILGLIARNQNNKEEAISRFRWILERDPKDIGANVNLGQILSQDKDYAEAKRYFQTAYDAEPYNTTAIYNLALTLQRIGDRDQAKKLLNDFQTLRENGAGTVIGQNYLEQGRYAEAISSTGAEEELVNRESPKVFFTAHKPAISDVTSRSKLFSYQSYLGRPMPENTDLFYNYFGVASTFIDSDNDGILELVIADSDHISLLTKNKANVFQVVDSGDLGVAKKMYRTGLIAGDYDNDGAADLFVLEENQPRLYRNIGDHKFRDMTKEAKIPEYPYLSVSCAFTDVDHDGDLDIFIAGMADISKTERKKAIFPDDFPNAPNQLLRNNGDGTFTDISEKAKIKISKGHAVAVVPTDYDNRRDIDLLVVNYGGVPSLFRNLRDNTFVDVARAVGLDVRGNWSSAAIGDFNKDSFVDFFFGQIDGVGTIAESDGKGAFTLSSSPILPSRVTASQFLDYDNDGLLDLLTINDRGASVLRNLGGNSWRNEPRAMISIRSAKESVNGSRFILSADLDSDGDMDLIARKGNGSLQLLSNQGRNSYYAKSIELNGLASNKSAIGAKIDLRAGSLSQKLESYSANPMPAPSQIHFGLGKRVQPDAIRVIWSSGIVQAETDFVDAKLSGLQIPAKITELDRKPSSCPYLFTWNGEKFEFITDFLGGGEMGNWAGEGAYHFPDSDEFVRIPPEALKPKDGRYELRITNELEEVLFMDKVELVALEHNENEEVYPNEGLGIPTFGQKINYTVQNPAPPLSARDGYGNDVLGKISSLDNEFYDTFRSKSIRGYAEQHSLILNVDDRTGFNGRTLLLMTGWTDYAFSSDNLAASQSDQSLSLPKLQVRNKQGQWQTVIESIGISIGRPQTLVVDLTGKFLSESREVRIITNFKTFWDKIEVDSSADNSEDLKISVLRPAESNLRERGFSQEVRFNGNPMVAADYENVQQFDKWKYFAGTFTRVGDVSELLETADDNFVISKTGDELVLSFPELPKPPKGRKYTFLLYADGYSKEMDINSGSPDAVFPLPFKQMSSYPYDISKENYPMDEARLKLFEKYNTRKVFRQFPLLSGKK